MGLQNMEVYFLRHGEAGKSSRGLGGDAARQLTEEGIARMEREAAFISALRLRLDAILTSPLVRAQQTAEIIARELRLLDALAVDERLSPGFGPEELAGIVQEHRAAAAVMLVGHEPDFSAVISECIGGGRVECKKGALARVDFDTPDSSSGVLVWLLPPRVLAP
jgi:phosphohistidine phosphatase